MTLIPILAHVILPIFVLIGIGFALDRLLRLDLPTLSKLNFYAFVPALIFIKILDTDLAGATMGWIAFFCLVHTAILYVAACVVFSHGAMKSSRTVLSLSAIFNNCGNYGIPLVVFAFGDEYIGPLAVVIIFQNLLSFTFGVWLLERESRARLPVILRLLRIPSVIVVVIALAMRWRHVAMAEEIRRPLDYLAQGLVPVALLTLGAQLSRSALLPRLAPISAVTVARLVVSPALAAALAPLFGFSGALAGLLVVTAGLPVAVNVYILAAEYGRDEELASQAVFWTTLLSAASVSILLLVYQP